MDVPYLSGSPDGDNVEVGLQAGVQQPVKVNQLAGGVVPHLGDHVIIHLYCVAFLMRRHLEPSPHSVDQSYT